MKDEEFIASVIKAREESVSFFSNAGKQERERWVVNEFLTNLGLRCSESDVVSSIDEPPDVTYRDGRFEVKEVMDVGKRRHAEYKESLRRAKEAKVVDDLLEEYPPRNITYTEVFDLVGKHLATIRPYAPATKGNLDLLFYINLEDVHGYISSEIPSTADCQRQGWRSISFVAGPMGVVLCATASAPSFLRAHVGKVMRQGRYGG